MDWSEIRVRAQQEVSKRLDLALYRSGLQASNGLEISPAKASGGFFFRPEELQARIDCLRTKLFPQVEQTIREAEDICAHRFSLLGFHGLQYGAEIDWHLDPVHGKRAPLIPWFKIDFLDFWQVGDHKVIWELNRHQHLVTLAKAWCFTGREAYAAELVKQWQGWQRANPYPLGINWASSLEVAFRSLSWLWVRQLLSDCPFLDAQFESRLLHALALNARHIEKYLSTYFSPNTHLLGEAVALFFIGTLCAQLPEAERWRTGGWRIVLQEADRQIRPDGVYFEQTLYYHVYALDFLLHARLLAERNGQEIPSAFDQILKRMLSVLDKISQSGPPGGCGDDDGGRVFNPRRNRDEHMTDPLALGAAIFSEDYSSSRGVTEESIWLCGDTAKPGIGPHPGQTKLQCAAFESGGIYVMASSGDFPQRMTIHAGPLGSGRGGHAHADALSFTLALDGRPWLVDPGTFCYISAGNERHWFRGTAAHNTLRVDNLDQAEAKGPFAWGTARDVSAQWRPGMTFALFAGSHTGYCRLPDRVVHRRNIFFVPGEFWLVRDVAEGKQTHKIETSWHFATDLRISIIRGGFLVEPVAGSGKHAVPQVCLLPAQRDGWVGELKQERVSPAYGVALEATVLRCQAELALPAEQAMLIVPIAHQHEPGSFVPISTPAPENCSAYCYESGGRRRHVWFADANAAPCKVGPWTSDARFFYCNVEQGRVVHLIMCDGSFVKLNGREVFAQPGKLSCFEWTDRNGEGQISPAGLDHLETVASALRSCRPVF